jgi:hypothetical protein
VDRHRLAEETSIRLHAVVANRIRQDASIVARARSRAASWLESGDVNERYARMWLDALDGSLEALCALLIDPSEGARALRQVSPFAGAVDARERWAIWRAVRSEHAAR